MGNKKAFTLIELLVCLAIVAALAIVAVFNFKKTFDRAYIKDSCNDLRAIGTAQQSYFESHANAQGQHIYYVSNSCPGNDTSAINSNLGITISPSGGATFCCSPNNSCAASLQGGGTITIADCASYNG